MTALMRPSTIANGTYKLVSSTKIASKAT